MHHLAHRRSLRHGLAIGGTLAVLAAGALAATAGTADARPVAGTRTPAVAVQATESVPITPEEALQRALDEVVPGATVTPTVTDSERDAEGSFDENYLELSVPGAASAEIELTYLVDDTTTAETACGDAKPKDCGRIEVLDDGTFINVHHWRWKADGFTGEQRMGGRWVNGVLYVIRAGEALTVQQVEDVLSSDAWAQAEAF